MRRSRKWFFTVLLTGTLLFCSLVLINCVVDAYGILRNDFSKQFQPPNEKFVKMKYILNNKNKYDSFIFGSSRVNVIDNKKIENGKYYNCWYSEGLPKEHLDNIKLLLKNNVRIKNILIGLDDFSYQVSPDIHLSNLQRQPHPLVTGKNFAFFYSEYFIKKTKFVRTVRLYILHNCLKEGRFRERGMVFDLHDSGRVLCRTCDELIEKDPGKHMRDALFDEPVCYMGDNLANAVEHMREIAALAEKNNINLTVFINPLHKTTYLATNREQLLTFKKALAAVTDYYDFSGLNSITTNNYYYYETSHYREMVGDMMLSRMFGEPLVSVPSDFGLLVTRQTVDAHLRKLAAQLNDSKSSVKWARKYPAPPSL